MKELTYNVREFQAHLGDALRAARRGNRVRIVARGVPDVILSQARSLRHRETAEERNLGRLAAQGKIRRAKHDRIQPFKPFTLAGVSDQVVADRR